MKKARQAGYRARAVYKLEEIDKKYRLLRPGTVVVDLGAAPGSWSQYATQRVGEKGLVVAVDLLEMPLLEGVQIISGDFTEPQTVESVLHALGGRWVDLVLSDMAPNISGIRLADQARAETLLEAVRVFCGAGLRPGGILLAKLFEGEAAGDTRERMLQSFEQLRTLKPKASRAESRESYLLGRGFRGTTTPRRCS